ncbi:MAG: hypothetical protein IH614_08155 [Desulfuromonadales bacterium]|nr:hypothetical protein [Desulfuromonadales bacterium]
MPKEQFDFPLGIRLWPSEVRSGGRRLKEGYLFSALEQSTDSYRFNALVGASKATALIRALGNCLPPESFLILEFYPEQGEKQAEEPVPTVYYSPYLPTQEIITTLEPYLPRLIHDGFVGFGLANNRAGFEFFYSEEKVLTCFAGDHLRLTDLFSRHGLPFRPHMTFPSDLGHDHLSLLCHPRYCLPAPFATMGERELDYLQFCGEITDQLEMYPVEESLSFFLSRRDQDLIEARLRSHEEFIEFAEEDFGSLLLDWNDFVLECEEGFTGDLWEYRQGLKLRDMVEFVMQGVPSTLRSRLLEIVTEADGRFQKLLIDQRKRLDSPAVAPASEDRFWYRGVVRNQGVFLRRDLIRQGWFKP